MKLFKFPEVLKYTSLLVLMVIFAAVLGEVSYGVDFSYSGTDDGNDSVSESSGAPLDASDTAIAFSQGTNTDDDGHSANVGGETQGYVTESENVQSTNEQRFIDSSDVELTHYLYSFVIEDPQQGGAQAKALDVQEAAIQASVAAEDLANAMVMSMIARYDRLTPEQAVALWLDEGRKQGYINDGEPSGNVLALIPKAYAAGQTYKYPNDPAPYSSPPEKVDWSLKDVTSGGCTPTQHQQSEDVPCGLIWGSESLVVKAVVDYPYPQNGSKDNMNPDYALQAAKHVYALKEASRKIGPDMLDLTKHGTAGTINQTVDKGGSSFFISKAYAQAGGGVVDQNLQNLFTALQNGKTAANTAHRLEGVQNPSAWDLVNSGPLSPTGNNHGAQAAALPAGHTMERIGDDANTLSLLYK